MKYVVCIVHLPEYLTGGYEVIDSFEDVNQALILSDDFNNGNDDGESFCIVEVRNE